MKTTEAARSAAWSEFRPAAEHSAAMADEAWRQFRTAFDADHRQRLEQIGAQIVVTLKAAQADALPQMQESLRLASLATMQAFREARGTSLVKE